MQMLDQSHWLLMGDLGFCGSLGRDNVLVNVQHKTRGATKCMNYDGWQVFPLSSWDLVGVADALGFGYWGHYLKENCKCGKGNLLWANVGSNKTAMRPKRFVQKLSRLFDLLVMIPCLYQPVRWTNERRYHHYSLPPGYEAEAWVKKSLKCLIVDWIRLITPDWMTECRLL